MNGPEVYGTVFALAPSRRDINTIWAGSDDGLIHVTRDGGKTWTNVTPTDMPEFGRVSIIDASPFDDGTAYAAVKRPLLDDFAPYIFRTRDYGKTWTKIVNGIRSNDYVHAVREDHVRKGLLFAGTQHGVYLSYDDGETWGALSLNLPDTQVSDLVVEGDDLAIATHGRGFYILDDIQPIRQFSVTDAASDASLLFAPGEAIRGVGGARISYWLKRPAKSLTLDILDANNQVVRSYTGTRPGEGRGRGAGRGEAGGRGTGEGRGGGQAATEEQPAEGGGGRGRGGAAGPSMAAGLNNFTWDLQYPGPSTFPGMVLWGASTAGPAAIPGAYQVRLTVDGTATAKPLTVKRHPMRDVTDADLKEQFDLAIRIRDKVSEANNAVIQIRNLKQQITERTAKSANAPLKAAGDRLAKNLSAVEEDIYQVRNQSNQDPLNFPIKINNRLASLLRVVNNGDGKPIGNAEPLLKEMSAELKVQTDRLQQVLATDGAAFNAEATRAGVKPLTER
jgi:hypothetical protein